MLDTEPIILGEMEYFTEEENRVRVYSKTEYNGLLAISKSDTRPVEIDNKYDAVYVMPYLSDELENAMTGRKVGLGDVAVSVAQVQKCMFTGFGAWHIFVVGDELFEELLSDGVIKDSYSAGDVLDRATVMNYTKSMSQELNAKLNEIMSGNTSGYRLAYNDYSEGLRIFGWCAS